jgi:branched-chain amino acid transport system permease protein
MLGWGLNIVVGLAGLLDLGYVAFYAVGAYSYALLATYFGLSFWICLPLAGHPRRPSGASSSASRAAAARRLSGDRDARLRRDHPRRPAQLGEFTGGPNGIGGIPRPTFFGLPFTRGEGGFAGFFGLEHSADPPLIFLYYLILVLALLTNFVTMRLRRCRSAAPGRRCARTRSPAARSASTPPTPS